MSSADQTNRPIQSISRLPSALSARPAVIFTDVDDTLTCDGQLPVETFTALYQLQKAGIEVVPVTGASAGWCDCLIKTWPVNHVIGENGAITMEKNERRIVSSQFAKARASVERDLARLKQVGSELSNLYPDVKYTQDQQFRLTDIAFDIGQAVTVDETIAQQATRWLSDQGVQARRSSIHINAWIGEYSKASGAMNWLNNRNIDAQDSIFIGDSPNDESMFEHFPISVGVANIKRFLSAMKYVPTYITEHDGGYGFVDMANVLLDKE